MVATRVGNQRASSITKRRWTLGVVSRIAAVATHGEVTGLLCIKKITQQLNPSLIIFNNKLDHNQQKSNYVGYDDDTQCYGHAPGPINESETWRMIGGNANGLRPYGYMVDLLSISKRTRALQAGMIALSETNTEWHKHELRHNTDKFLIKAFGAARTEYGTSSEKIETFNYKPGGTL
jgi:hypothetical protein